MTRASAPSWPFARALAPLGAAFLRFRDKRGWVMSSHVAMSMLLALFPFLLFVVAVAGALTQDVQTEALIQLVIGTWPDEIADPIAREVRAVLTGGSGRVLTLGAALALYFASNGVDALRAAMTRAYHGDDGRPWWRQRLLCLLFVLAGALALVLAAVGGIAAPLYFHFMQERAPQLYTVLFGNDLLRQGLAVAAVAIAVTACHLWLPGRDRGGAPLWPGIALTLLLWWGAGWGFALYLDRFASYGATYAGLAGAMAALMFLYLMSAILILGAEYNAALGRRRDLDGPHVDGSPGAV